MGFLVGVRDQQSPLGSTPGLQGCFWVGAGNSHLTFSFPCNRHSPVWASWLSLRQQPWAHYPLLRGLDWQLSTAFQVQGLPPLSPSSLPLFPSAPAHLGYSLGPRESPHCLISTPPHTVPSPHSQPPPQPLPVIVVSFRCRSDAANSRKALMPSLSLL